MFKKLATIMMSLVLCTSLLVGCNNSETGNKKIGLIVSTLNNPFFVDLKTGIENEAKKLGYDIVVLDSQNDPAKEVSNMEDISVKDVDVVLLNPVDSDSAIASVMVANNLELPVITVDRAANGGEVISHVASDNVEGGKMAAQYLVQELNNSGKIVELEGIAGSSATRDRGDGFDNEIKKSNLEIITKQSADFDRTKGLSVMENIIQSKGEINAVFAQNDEMALGALKALQDANMNDVLVVGFDATDDAIESVKQGNLAATIAQQPILIGETAVDLAHRFLQGEKVEDFAPVELKLISRK